MLKRTLILSLCFSLFAPFMASAQTIPTQRLNKELHAKLPADIQKAGYMVSVNSGSFPPYDIITENKTYSGASADFNRAIGEILGIKIKQETVSTLPALLMGLKAGRFQFAMGPIGDFPARQENADFIDYVQEFVVFAVLKGNPNNIQSLSDICGLRVSVMAGGSAEKVIRTQSKVCTDNGQNAIQIQSYADQPTSILAVRAKRADAFFSSQAPLSYYVIQSKGELELTALGQKNGFDDLYQGAVVAKNSPLGDILLQALQELFDNGTYAIILKKWGLEGNKISAPGMNIAKDKVQ